MILNQIETDKYFEQALIVHSNKGPFEDTRKKWKQGKGQYHKEASPFIREKKKIEDKLESLKGGGGFNRNQCKIRFQDQRKIQCLDCEKYGHFAFDYWFGKGMKTKTGVEEANMTQDDSDSNPIMIMVTTCEGAQ